MNFMKAATPLLWRVAAFVGLFVIISGLIGPRIINGNIIFRDGFAIYGSLGKTAIFGLIAFVLLVRHNKVRLPFKAWRPQLLMWGGLAGICTAIAWVGVSGLLAGERTYSNLFLAHAGLILATLLAAISCFGPDNLLAIWRTYKREIIGSLIICVAFYCFLLMVYALWHPLASTVLVSVAGLLHVVGLEVMIVPPHTLLFDRFGITVAEFCSGIESIALFTGLYAIVGLLDWKQLNKKRYLLLFPVALLLLFGLNIIRVFTLIMAGYYINPEIAFSLFHTYAGMVFFILYSAAFWSVAYKYLLDNKNPE